MSGDQNGPTDGSRSDDPAGHQQAALQPHPVPTPSHGNLKPRAQTPNVEPTTHRASPIDVGNRVAAMQDRGGNDE